MNLQVQPDVAAPERRIPFERVALVLQGGGALGAYQAGVYEALAEAGIHPDWIAGVSVGAINAAIIAGNPPTSRIERLCEFWTQATAGGHWPWFGGDRAARGDVVRNLFNQVSAGFAFANGAPGFFTARALPPWLQPAGTIEATSFYDTGALKHTLERLVDFDRLNAGAMRFSAGAVNVRTGNFVYFDTTTHTIRPEHVMASGALPPGLPAIEIEGEHYWDGGLVSNTPLQWVVESEPRHDTLAFQVDLWSARGEFPRTMLDVMTREKEIRYSSRTRLNTDFFMQLQSLRRAFHRLHEKLPPELRNDPDARMLDEHACGAAITIVHLIHRRAAYERFSMDYEFSRLSMLEHWQAGLHDVRHTLNQPAWRERKKSDRGVTILDLTRDEESEMAK